jgi:hypothetical protein
VNTVMNAPERAARILLAYGFGTATPWWQVRHSCWVLCSESRPAGECALQRLTSHTPEDLRKILQHLQPLLDHLSAFAAEVVKMAQYVLTRR